MAYTKQHASFHAIPQKEVEEADEVQLRTIAHSLLESKLEKMMSTAGNVDELTKTKKLAIEWMRRWDLDGDGILSSIEMRGAAMEHVKLQRDYKTRGIWMLVLLILIVCCGGVILGVSIWANAISKDSEVESGDDLGGFTMRKKDGSAVVKTATALYEFRLPRIGYVPFDELSAIESISFVYQRSMRKMAVEGFKWYGTHNVTFYSPRGEVFSVVRHSENTSTIMYQDRGATEPYVVHDGLDPAYEFLETGRRAIDMLVAANMPLTPENVFGILSGELFDLYNRTVPSECLDKIMAFISSQAPNIEGTCGVMYVALFEGSAVVEAGIGPQDYYGTQMSKEEYMELSGDGNTTLRGNIFDPDPVTTSERYRVQVEENLIKERLHS